MIVVITAAAEYDLETIADRIAPDSPARALTFLAELRRRCATLIDAPRPTRSSHAMRLSASAWPYRDYLIFYRVSDDSIEILHVLHGARDYETILFPDERQ